MRILVVDDDPAVRGMVADVLAVEGHDVVTAADGSAAVAAIEAVEPDCVVLDVMMPGLDGHEVLEWIRSSRGHALPVVMLTAAADDDHAWRAWRNGVDYFLAKPFDAAELLRWLDYLDLTPGSVA